MNVTIETKYRVMWIDENGNRGDVGYPVEDMEYDQAERILLAYEKRNAKYYSSNIRYDIYEVNYEIPVIRD